jgi:hypothetical protein
MSFSLDHLIVFVDSASRAEALSQYGIPIMRRGPHRGGGSGNVVYGFANGLLELAYPIDWGEIEAMGAIGFSARWRWRETGAAPLGIVVRGALPADQTWTYQPAFDPERPWTVGRTRPDEPLVMTAPPGPAGAFDASLTIERVTFELPATPRSAVIRQLVNDGVVGVIPNQAPLLALDVGGLPAGVTDLRPQLPLLLRHAAT